jgi:hypothetical protein
VSREAEKELAAGLKALGTEYAQRQLKASSQGREIKNRAGWLRSVGKAVTSPEGEHYETACRLFVEYPGSSAEELCDLLEGKLSGAAQSSTDSAEGFFAPGSGWIRNREIHTSDEPREMPPDYLLTRAKQLYAKNGYPVALDYLQRTATPDKLTELADELRKHALSDAGQTEAARLASEQEKQLAEALEASVLPESELLEKLQREVIGRFTLDG